MALTYGELNPSAPSIFHLLFYRQVRAWRCIMASLTLPLFPFFSFIFQKHFKVTLQNWKMLSGKLFQNVVLKNVIKKTFFFCDAIRPFFWGKLSFLWGKIRAFWCWASWEFWRLGLKPNFFFAFRKTSGKNGVLEKPNFVQFTDYILTIPNFLFPVKKFGFRKT